MRAKLALALAAFGFMLSSSQALLARDLQTDVNYILYDTDSHGLFSGLFGGRNRAEVLTQPAIAGGPCCPRPSIAGESGRQRILELPLLVAPTTCSGTAIITKYPSDLDIRREDLARRLSDAGGTCAFAGGAGLSSALAQIGCAEVQFRSDEYLDVRESRRL